MAITNNPWEMPMDDLRQAAFSERKQQAGLSPELDQAYDEFLQTCSDFQNTEQNIDVLFRYIKNPFIATADDLRQAHALATYHKQYAAPQPEANPWAMEIGELQKQSGVNPFRPPEQILPAQPDQSDTAQMLFEAEHATAERAATANKTLDATTPYISGR